MGSGDVCAGPVWLAANPRKVQNKMPPIGPSRTTPKLALPRMMITPVQNANAHAGNLPLATKDAVVMAFRRDKKCDYGKRKPANDARYSESGHPYAVRAPGIPIGIVIGIIASNESRRDIVHQTPCRKWGSC